MYRTPLKLYSISTNPKDTRGNQRNRIMTWWVSSAVSSVDKYITDLFYDKQENTLLKACMIWTLLAKLFIPCNERAHTKWTEWTQYIMLFKIEPKSPEAGLPRIGLITILKQIHK